MLYWLLRKLVVVVMVVVVVVVVVGGGGGGGFCWTVYRIQAVRWLWVAVLSERLSCNK